MAGMKIVELIAAERREQTDEIKTFVAAAMMDLQTRITLLQERVRRLEQGGDTPKVSA
jgi:hypothetical protein